MIGKDFAIILQLVVTLPIKYSSGQDVFNINTKKVVASTSEKFLSLTFDPAVLMTGDVLASSTEQSTNMAKGLAPGYVRLAGPRSNAFTFERSLFPQNDNEEPNFTFSEAHWVLVQEWAQRAGLDVVSCLTPQRIENEDKVAAWDPRNSLDLISFSDHMGYNISWQLGYECQTRCDISGFDLGRDVARLRNMLGAFPRYSNSLIAGPDVVNLKGKQQQQFIQDYLNAAGNALSVITWHPDFAGISLDADGVALQTDTLAADKDLLYKAMGRTVAKKPLWIAESKPEECKRQFLGALVWARRLGSAAKLGVQVIMRQPDATNILQPTPDYWVSLLHKNLVGREVLDAKLMSGNKTHVHFYCHCTKPSAKYDKGAVTIFGLNLTPNKVSVSLKGLKIKTIHKYILMPGYDNENRMFAETVLLNNEPLNLVDGKTLPDINPAVTLIGKNMAVKLSSGGIGFWVVPGARVKSCLGHDEEAGDKTLLKKLTKRLEESETIDENVGHEVDEDQDFETESETEDIKSILKAKMRKRKLKHSDEVEDEERRFKRLDAKRELEKFEKFLKRNSNNDDKKSSHFKGRMGLAMFDGTVNESTEDNKNDDSSEEEMGLISFKNDKTNSLEDINAKIEDYKKKLIQYEARKKNQLDERFVNKNERSEDAKTDSFRERNGRNDENSLPVDIDSQKAIEALALISKVEGAMRKYSGSEKKTKYDVAPNNVSDTGEELLIEELKKQEKSKRMIDPESLDKLYEFLISNREQAKMQKRDVRGDLKVEKSRRKRDLEKLLGDDPLGLKKEGLFKKRLRSDDVKERRLERRFRKKEKEEIGLKKDLIGVARFDPRLTDSNENNFFGFPEMKPVENFPEGDVHFSEGSSSEEKNRDYDYVKEDDDAEMTKKQKRNNKHRKSNGKKENTQVADETWVEEPNSNFYQAPKEFFEKLNLPPVRIETQWKDYGELWEPESLQHKELKENNKKVQQETETADETVIPRDRPDDREDKRAKETAVKKLINYYDNSEVLRSEKIFGQEKPQAKDKKNKLKLRPEAPIQSKAKTISRPKPEQIVAENTKRVFGLDNNYEDSADIGSMQFVNSKESEDYSEETYKDDDDNDDGVIVSELRTKGRSKRSIGSIDDMLNQEMILEDVDNFKDCKCRVIRGTGKLRCKNCKRTLNRRARDVEDYSAAIPNLTTVEPNTEDEEPSSVDTNDEEIISEHQTDQIEDIEPSQQTYTASDSVLLGEETPPESNPEIFSASEVQSTKYTEVDDLNRGIDDSDSTSYASIPINGVSSSDGENAQLEDNVPAPSLDAQNPQTDDAEVEIIGTTGGIESVNDTAPELQEVSDPGEVRVEEEGSIDDTVGSKRLLEKIDSEDGETILGSETPTLDKGNSVEPEMELEDEKKADNIGKNGSDKGNDEIHAKRQTPELSDSYSDSEPGTRISLGTGTIDESSTKFKTTDGLQSKLKDKLEMKLKSGLKSDLGKSKLVLNTEALSALIKENESKKAEVMKALESSVKLRSVDNAKYLEYQKKRTEKLASLKEKLKERKAKILQQYRQELMDALSKCDDEVEKNLKRREIWDNFTQEDEFQDFVDKDKLAYLVMHRPVNYENTEEQEHGEARTEDRRYYPQIAFVQPLRNPREQKIPSIEKRRTFYEPKATDYIDARDFPSSQELFFDQSSEEDAYYAIVDSMENPKVFHKKNFEEYQNDGQKTGPRNAEPYVNFDDKKLENFQYNRDKLMPRRYTEDNHVTKESDSQGEAEEIVREPKNEDERVEHRFHYHPKYGYPYRHPQPVYAIEGGPLHRRIQGDEPMVHAYYDEDFSQENGLSSYYDDYPEGERSNLYETYDQEASESRNIMPPESENHKRIYHYQEDPRTVMKGREQFLVHRRMAANPEITKRKSRDELDANPEELTVPKRFTFDVTKMNDKEKFVEDRTSVRDGFGIMRRLQSPYSEGRCGNQIFGCMQEFEEPQMYGSYPREKFGQSDSEINFPRRPIEKRLSRNGRHLIPQNKQVVDEPSYKMVSPDSWQDSTVRKEREVKEKRGKYICLKEDSQEESTENDKQLFQLVKNNDYYAAVPITDLTINPEELANERQRKDHRRVASRDGKVRTKRRKYSTDDFRSSGNDYYSQKGDNYPQRSLAKRQYSEKEQINENSAWKSHDETDYREIGDEINRLETGARLSPEEYELLMLIPVKKLGAKRRHRRELMNNEIDRFESFEDMKNKPWDDLLDVKWNEENLLEDVKDPLNSFQNFERVVLNLGSPDQEKLATIMRIEDEPNGIYLEDYSKENILENIDGFKDKGELPTTSTPNASSPSTFLDIAIPKLESTINNELNKVGNLTESLEDFINEFEDRFNTTTEVQSNKTENGNPNEKLKTNNSFFYTILKKVKKFFNFLTGISLVFNRY